MKKIKKCPICGAMIDDDNFYRCSRFPICTYQMPVTAPNQNSIQIVWDIETTGFSRSNDRIIEIGAVKINSKGAIIDRFNMICNPGLDNFGKPIMISATIRQLTGINNAMVKNQPLETAAVASFIQWIKEDKAEISITHNGDKFDIPFLKSACLRAKVGFPFVKSIDTLHLAKNLKLLDRGCQNLKQSTLAAYYNIIYNAHRACDDAEALFKIYQEMLKDAAKYSYTIQPKLI